MACSPEICLFLLTALTAFFQGRMKVDAGNLLVDG